MVAKRKAAKKKAAPKTVAKKVAAPKAAAAKTTKRKTSRKAAKKTAVAKAPVQRVGGWWFGSFSGSGLLIAVSSLLAVCAFFFGWIHFSQEGFNWTFNGLDFLTVKPEWRTEIFQDSWQLMIPLFEFILAILAFIAIIIPAFGVRGGRLGIDAFVVIVGITMFILAICFLFGNVALDLNNKFINNLDVGFYITIVASVIMILGGLRDATKNY